MDVLDALLAPELLLFTIPVVVSLTVWLLSLVGLFDFEMFDLDIEADVDVDMDVDLAPGIDAGGGGLAGLLGLLGLGMIPLSLGITLLLFFFGWTGIGLHALLGGIVAGWGAGLVALVLGPLALAGGLAAEAASARLLEPLFRDHGRADSAADFIGKVGRVKSASVDHAFGTITLTASAGVPIDVAARVDEGDAPLPFGAGALVVDYDPEGGVYLVAPYDEALLPAHGHPQLS